jgi:transcriptional regulator with XRE-family HTH domain
VIRMADIDLGSTLRRLRRIADLSQRELAARAGLPPSTVARIESGAVHDPRLRTVERLARAAGGSVLVTSAQPDPNALATAVSPDDNVIDRAGRHFPAHLDVQETYSMIDESNRLLPAGTMVRRFERYRGDRDERRERMARAAEVEITGGETEPATTRAWPQQVTALRRLRKVVFCRLAVAEGWQRIGIERRLLLGLHAVVAEHGFAFAVTLGYARSDVAHLRDLGFHPQVRWVTAMRLVGYQ